MTSSDKYFSLKGSHPRASADCHLECKILTVDALICTESSTFVCTLGVNTYNKQSIGYDLNTFFKYLHEDWTDALRLPEQCCRSQGSQRVLYKIMTGSSVDGICEAEPNE